MRLPTVFLVLAGSILGAAPTAVTQCVDYGDYLHWSGTVRTPNDARGVAVAGEHAFLP